MVIANPILKQVETFNNWKNEIIRDIARYRAWLRDNLIYDQSLDQQLQSIQGQLRHQGLSFAFVGEFSRGKTELINALLFSKFGQRVLPSTVGRTTMCPTEFIYDAKEPPFLKLLPIETRQETHPLKQLKKYEDRWQFIPIDLNDVASLQRVFSEISETKKVTTEEAELLGFDCQYLERSSDDNVYIPAWRHALVNFDHPILRKGIRILDTPGLNALGCEPDLTFSLLPECQAIIFILNIDSGVSATDMQIWRDHVEPLRHNRCVNLFAALNKVDLLWDDVAGPATTEQWINKIKTLTANQLNIGEEHIFTLSAKQALHARIKNDESLLKKSNIESFELLLLDKLIEQIEGNLRRDAISKTIHLLGNTKSTLQTQLNNLEREKVQLTDILEDDLSKMKALAKDAKHQQVDFQKKIILLKSSKKKLSGNLNTLLAPINPDHFAIYFESAKRNFKESWSSVGINNAIEHFFACLDNDLNNLDIEVKNIFSIVQTIYDNFQLEDERQDQLKPSSLNTEIFKSKLNLLKNSATSYQKSFRSILKGQRRVTEHFINSVANEAEIIHQQANSEAKQWFNGLLTPLMQYTVEQKQQLDNKVTLFKSLAETNKTKRQRQEEINQFLVSLELQLDAINLMISSISQKRD